MALIDLYFGKVNRKTDEIRKPSNQSQHPTAVDIRNQALYGYNPNITHRTVTDAVYISKFYGIVALEGSKFCYVIFKVVRNIHGASNVLLHGGSNVLLHGASNVLRLFFINFMSLGHVGVRTEQNHALTPSPY
jgi:hypothetical protein